MASRRIDVDRLRVEIEAKLDDLDRQLAETEQHLRERQAEVAPAEGPLLPLLRKRRRKAGA